MTESARTANNNAFVAYRVLSRSYFHIPVLLVYFYFLGISPFVIFLLLATYSASSFAVPALSRWLNGRSRAGTVVLFAEILKALGLVGLILGPPLGEEMLTVFFVAQFVGGVGFGLALSNDNNLLGRMDREAFARVQARTQALMIGATFFAGVAGAALFLYDPRLPLLASLIATLLAGATLLFTTSTQTQSVDASKAAVSESVDHAGRAEAMLHYATVRAFALGAFVGFLPYLFVTTDLPVYFFGLVLGCFTLTAFAAARWMRILLDQYGTARVRLFLNSTLLLAFAAIAVSGFLPSSPWQVLAGLFAVLALGAVAGAIRLLTVQRLALHHAGPQERSSLLASMERLQGWFSLVVLVGGGAIVQWLSVNALFWSLVAAAVVALAVGALYRHRTAGHAAVDEG